MKNLVIAVFCSYLLIGCSPKPETTTMSKNNLASKIEYADKISNKMIFDTENYQMILFALKSDQLMKPHSAPIDAPLLVLEGTVRVTIEDKEFMLEVGDMLTLPKDLPHGVYPQSDCKFLLIK